MYLISPPSHFSPTKRWEDFLAKMQKLPQDDQNVQWAIKRAREELNKRKGVKKPWWTEIEDDLKGVKPNLVNVENAQLRLRPADTSGDQ